VLPLLSIKEFKERWKARGGEEESAVYKQVESILTRIREEGDQALKQLSRQIEGLVPQPLFIPRQELEKSLTKIPSDQLEAMKKAAERIRAYHRHQLQGEHSAMIPGGDGEVLGWINRPLKRVACYAPGGRAPYPSTVLMTAIPAQVAGVEDVVVASPPQKQGEVALLVQAAAFLAGASGIYQLGGALAVGALAYGTETIPRVDKIVGPGNRYLEIAKRLVAGAVGTDLPAGPSEVIIVADSGSDPRLIAADLLAQAEHGPDSAAVLITTNRKLVAQTDRLLTEQVVLLEHAGEAKAAISDRGGAVAVRDLEEAIDLANWAAPEHLQLFLDDAWSWLGKVENAGAVFISPVSPVPVGDYWAGPSHVLPTGGAARFASPLGVSDFRKRISVVACSSRLLQQAACDIKALAEGEGFTGHARSVTIRVKKE